MAAAKVFKNPGTFTYDATPATGCTSVTIADSAAPQTTMCDDGTVVHWVAKGSISGTATFIDHIQAVLVANQTAALKDITFIVQDEAETAHTVTLTNAKTGGVQDTYALNGAHTASVSFVADSVSSPTE